MFRLTPRANNPASFFQNLVKRRQEWSNARIAARVVVPSELSWWYFQEFGTAVGGRSGQTDSTGGASGSKYVIKPVEANILSWTNPGGETVFRESVNHPGVPSHHFVTRTLADNLQIASIKFIAAMDRSRWSVQTVRQSLLEEVMPRVKENIVEMIGLTLPGTRVDGKLGGASAAQVFESNATIIDLSDGSTGAVAAAAVASASGSGSGRAPFKKHTAETITETTARPFESIKNLPWEQLSKTERLALLGGNRNSQEYQKSLHSHRISQYFKNRKKK